MTRACGHIVRLAISVSGSVLLAGGCPDTLSPPGDPSLADNLVVAGPPAVFGALSSPSSGQANIDSREFLDVSITDAGVAASVKVDGFLRIFTVGSAGYDSETNLNAVSAAWSNDGKRLAVIARTSGQLAPVKLLLLSSSTDALAEIPIDMSLAGGDARQRFAISWSGDDAKIAISTDAAVAIRADESIGPRCVIVKLSDESVETYDLYNVFYVGREDVVGTIPAAGPATEASASLFSVHAMRLSHGVIETAVLIPGAGVAVASRPSAGVFVSADWEVPIPLSVFSPRIAINVRSVDGRFRFGFWGDDRGQKFVLIPKELVFRVFPSENQESEGG